jgi:hypothetical protein
MEDTGISRPPTLPKFNKKRRNFQARIPQGRLKTQHGNSKGWLPRPVNLKILKQGDFAF